MKTGETESQPAPVLGKAGTQEDGREGSQQPQQVRFDRRFLIASRRWLRDAEVQRLTISPPFADEEQETWFAGLAKRSDYLIWGIELGDTPVGAFGLKCITHHSAEFWGYIGEKQYWGRGIGRWMMQAAVKEARDRGVSRLTLRVLQSNERAVALYRKTGFRCTGEDEDVYWMARDI